MDRRRDRNNELIVAIAVIGTLALALTFGIILSLSRTIDNESDDQATSTASFRVTVKTSTVWGIVGIVIVAAVAAALVLVFRKFGRR